LLVGFVKNPDNKCHLRNVYLYINEDSLFDARQLIKDCVISGNTCQVLVQMYKEKPGGKELPNAEEVFTDLKPFKFVKLCILKLPGLVKYQVFLFL